MPQETYPIVPSTARVDIRGTLTGGFSIIQAQYSVYVRAPGVIAWTLTTLGELRNLIVTWWDDHMQPITSNQAVLSQVVAKDLGQINGAEAPVSPNLTGAVASELALSVGAPVVQLLVESGSEVPKSYFNPWGMAETQSHGNTLESTYQSALATAVGELHAAIEGFSGTGWGLNEASSVVVSVGNPGYDPATDPPTQRYRDEGITSHVLFMSPRQLVGRRVSRQT